MPKVSVIMLVFNGQNYLQAAINSIITQTFYDLELIIIDNGSTDNSLDKIKAYSDKRIRLIIIESNIGIVKARNIGLSHACGTYIACMDCDDISYPTRLEEQVAFMEANPEFGAVGSWCEVIDEIGKLTGEVVKFDAPSELIPSILLFNNYFAHSSTLIRRSALPIGGYRSCPGAEDYDLIVRLSNHHKVVNLPKVLLMYRVYSQSYSNNKTDIIEGYVRNIIGYQLERLRITPTNEEINIHRLIYNHANNIDLLFMKKASAWLHTIISQNKLYEVYDNKYLQSCIGSKWFYLLLSVNATKFEMIKKIIISRLSLLSIKYILLIIIHRAKCYVKRLIPSLLS